MESKHCDDVESKISRKFEDQLDFNEREEDSTNEEGYVLDEEDDTDDFFSFLPGCGEDKNILAKAARWFGDENKSEKCKLLRDFAKENWQVFENDTSKYNDGSGHSLEYDDCHRRYLETYAEALDLFLEEEGSTEDEFQAACEKVLRGESITLFNDDTHDWFLQALFASLDYQHFYTYMLKQAEKYSRQNNKRSSHK